MLTATTVLTIAGGGLALGLIETVLESMGKHSYKQVVRTLAVIVFVSFGLPATLHFFNTIIGMFL